jgi:hypothetical protein
VDWGGCEDPLALLGHLRGRVGERKLRLWACALARRGWDDLVFWDEQGGRYVALQKGVAVAERFADGQADLPELAAAASRAAADYECSEYLTKLMSARYWGADDARRWAAAAVRPHGLWEGLEEACRELVLRARPDRWSDYGPLSESVKAVAEQWGSHYRGEVLATVGLLREVMGGAMRLAAFGPAWRTPEALALARTAYEERRFEDLPLLADALEEAGCTEEAILLHCRAPGPHARGCWVVDRLLGKE